MQQCVQVYRKGEGVEEGEEGRTSAGGEKRGGEGGGGEVEALWSCFFLSVLHNRALLSTPVLRNTGILVLY